MKTIIWLLILASTLASAKTKTLKVGKLTAGIHSVTLTWNASTSTCSAGLAYNAYRGNAANGENYTTPLNGTPVNALTYTDNSVAPLTTYFYTVKAYCASSTTKESGPSNEVNVTIPGDPQPTPPPNVVVSSSN